MADAKDESNMPVSSTTTKSPGGPIIQQSQESEEYQRALQTVVGTALGVIILVGLLAVFFLLYRLRRQRRRAHLVNGSQQHSPILQRSTSIDGGNKPIPSLLVLYSFDCSLHEAVVVALSGLLMEVCGVAVSLDVFDDNVIVERGLEEWLEDRLQEADYILVVCSLGARLRCSKKRVCFREEPGRVLPDYFAVAVDYVAEKLRAERSKGLGIEKFITVVMDYSRLSDVPPQLEASKTYSLMRDFHALCTHLLAASPNLPRKMPKDMIGGHGEGDGEAWQLTEAGMELWAALGQAREYFKSNPNWLEERLQPLPPRVREKKPGKRRRRKGGDYELPLLPMTTIDMRLSHKNSVTDLSINNDVPLPHTVDYENEQIPPSRKGPLFTSVRQSSLPTSLCSNNHQLPPSITSSLCQNISRSMDSFPRHDMSISRLDFGEESTCLLCQQQQERSWGGARRVQCPLHSQKTTSLNLSNTDADSELDNSVVAAAGEMQMGSVPGGMDLCSRSKSLPSVEHPSLLSPTVAHLPCSQTVMEGFTNQAALSSNLLSHSRTVLQAEVHKEWDGTSRPHQKEDKSCTFPPYNYKQTHINLGQNLEMQELGVSRSAKAWDLSQVPENLKEWGTVQRPGLGRTASSSSVSSTSSQSSFSSCSGSDSLERDLRSFTVPRIFDHSGNVCFGQNQQLDGDAPIHSLSSSVLAPGVETTRPNLFPCLTPRTDIMHFTFDLSANSPFSKDAGALDELLMSGPSVSVEYYAS